MRFLIPIGLLVVLCACDCNESGGSDAGQDAEIDGGPDAGDPGRDEDVRPDGDDGSVDQDDAGVSDGESDGQADSGADAQDAADGEDIDGGDEVEPLEPLVLQQEACLEGLELPNTPSLYLRDGQLWVFCNAQTGLNLQTSQVDTLEFSAPRLVHDDGYNLEMIEHSGGLLALAAGDQLRSYLLSSPDGQSWELEHTFIAGNFLDDKCKSKVPLFFFLPLTADWKVALGYDHYSGFLGCSPSVHFTRLESGDWTESFEVTRYGTIAGAFALQGKLSVASTHNAYYSEDDGVSFQEVPDGGVYSGDVRGFRMVADENESLYLVNAYQYWEAHTVAVLVSRDGGKYWDEKLVVYQGDADTYIIDPTLAICGTTLVVGWLNGDRTTVINNQFKYSAFVSYSPDLGASWSLPVRIDQAGPDQNLAEVRLVCGPDGIFGAYSQTGEDIFTDFENLCVVGLREPD